MQHLFVLFIIKNRSCSLNRELLPSKQVDASVAKMLVRWTLDPRVAGSIPSGGIKRKLFNCVKNAGAGGKVLGRAVKCWSGR